MSCFFPASLPQAFILTSNQLASRLSWAHSPALGVMLPAITVVGSLAFNTLLPIAVLLTQRATKRGAPVRG